MGVARGVLADIDTKLVHDESLVALFSGARHGDPRSIIWPRPGQISLLL